MQISSLPLKVALAFTLALTIPSTVGAAPDDPIERAFRAGNDFAAKNQFAQALAQYRIVLKASPDEPSALWNGGSAAYSVGDYKTASAFFARLQKQEPNNGHLLSKRIQTTQELGDLKTRDILRTRIFDLHKNGKDTEGYASKPRYCRDQFLVGKDQVFAFEYFDLKPLSGKKEQPYLGRRFDFIIGPPDGEVKLRVECGWSSLDITPDGKYVPSQELPSFYYDAYYPTGPWSRRTYGLGPTEPAFEAIKTEVIAIINGKAKQVSGQKREEEE